MHKAAINWHMPSDDNFCLPIIVTENLLKIVSLSADYAYEVTSMTFFVKQLVISSFEVNKKELT